MKDKPAVRIAGGGPYRFGQLVGETGTRTEVGSRLLKRYQINRLDSWIETQDRGGNFQKQIGPFGRAGDSEGGQRCHMGVVLVGPLRRKPV